MAKARFEELAAGLFLPAADRNSLVKELPYVNSTLALVPSIDDQLRGKILRKIFEDLVRIAGVLFEKNVMVSMKLSDVWKLHETLLVGLNLREMIEKIGSDGEGGPFDGQSGRSPSINPHTTICHFSGSARLLGCGWKTERKFNQRPSAHRERVGTKVRKFLKKKKKKTSFPCRARNVHAFRAMPSLGRLPLDGSSFLHRVSNSVLPNLFGEVLRGELTSADSSAAKALERLRDKSDQNRSRGSSSHSRKNPRQPMSSRRTSGSSSSSKRPAEFKKSQGAPNARKAKK
ncbi:hypothetical protein WR25_10089 [Diploscapter pachys]|uniref:Uncharacterized protein n=1 Tax=Diploscapter pachys TaxID=2018661 RepID=A0A2A2LFA4_9BILA|nr:hypothetical protein WR25_10089 [Diploscapter pachys]